MVRTVSEAARSGEPFDYIVVTLKALPDIYSVPDIIEPAVVEGKTTIVLIQNGIGNASTSYKGAAEQLIHCIRC